MWHFVSRTLSTALLLSILVFPVTVLSQERDSKALAATSETAPVEPGILHADTGPGLKVKDPVRKESRIAGDRNTADQSDQSPLPSPTFATKGHPREDHLQRAHSFRGDLRILPQTPPQKFERPELEAPEIVPVPYPGTTGSPSPDKSAAITAALFPSAPAPTASSSFEGLDYANWGAGHPPDTNGDVGPTHFIQTINTSVGIYNKSDGSLVTAFSFNTLMSQGNFGNLCDTANFGDPMVLYDTFEDRWTITDFAFNLSGGSAVAPAFQCFAISKSGDPVAGGWNFYSFQINGGLGDYPKFGIWPDGLYMSANIFSFGAGGTFQNSRVWAINKAEMYAGNPTVRVLSFDAPSAEFTLLPSNARLQTGTPPAGSPNYYAVVAQFLNIVSVYKFHVDWNNVSTSTLSGPSQSLTSTSWSQLLAANQTEQSPANKLDTLYPRLMMQNQYTNLGGVESLWNAHTVGGSGATSAQSAIRYYQVKVSGGSVEANATQAFTYNPDATVFRFMPSVALDRAGDMAIGYSATNGTLNPAIRYAGRLAGDAANSISLTEQSLIEGTGTQSGTCGTTCTRWGDYSAMTLDQDGCTFWYTNLYFQTTGLAFNTRIGAFSFPGCTPALSGTLQGAVSSAASGNPIGGATVALGSRITSTDVNGLYSFAGLPSGTYPSITASFPGDTSVTVADIVINDGSTTTQDFSLALGASSGCLTDTSQADFQGGVPTSCDLTGTPGDVVLMSAPNIDQQNLNVTTNGFGFTSTSWGGQTFQAGVSGALTRADLDLFCSGCTGTTPNLTVSIRATTGSPAVPTGADLATATVAGFSTNSSGFFTANFGTPAILTAGTTYAVIFRVVSNPSAGVYAYVCSCTTSTNPYTSGQRVTSSNSGSSWTADVTAGGRDIGFKIFVTSGFPSSGTFVSSAKDSNPDLSSSATWGTLSWSADTPAGTNVQLQAAANNNPSGVFNFVGPDGTAATFFSSGASLSQFNGSRYLRYQALLTTSDSTLTPSLHDVTVCFSDILATTLAVAPASGTFGGTANLSATLSAGATAVSGKTVDFTLNGIAVGNGATDGSGIATVLAVSLAGINPGNYPAAVGASFAGDSAHTTSSGTAALTVSQGNQTITFAALSNKNFGDPDFTVSATATSTLTVTFSAGGNCTVTVATVHITGVGSCTITASQSGDTNYNAAADVPQTFSTSKASQTITFAALSNKNFGDPDFAVSATATSALAVTFSATGVCTVTGATVHITGGGSCTITASQAGDASYTPATPVPQTFSIAKSSQTITFGALLSKNFGDPDFTVSATVSSSLTVTFSATGNCTVLVAAVHVTGAGSCTVTASQVGDTNFNSATPVPQSFAVNQALPVVTLACPPASFDVNAHSCTATVIGIGNVVVTGATALSYNSNSAPPANAGTYTVAAIFTSGDGNYANATGSGSLVIAKGTPTIAIACPLVIFDGNPHGCTAAASGVAGAAVSGTSILTYNGAATPSAGGTYSVSASFASGDSNYGNNTGTGSLIIAKAGQTITFAALPTKTIGYADFAIAATASSSLSVNFSVSGSCTLVGSTLHLTAAGSCAVTASQTGDTNYNPATSIVRTFIINSNGDFTIVTRLPVVVVSAGQSATEHITITPNPAILTPLALTCSGLPARASCTFAPNPVTPGSTPTEVVLTISTTAAIAAVQRQPVFNSGTLAFGGLGLLGMIVAGVRTRSRKRVLILVACSLAAVFAAAGCASGQRAPVHVSTTSTVTVTGSTSAFTHSATFTLTVN